VRIWALCWRRDKPHRRRRVHRPDNPFRHSGDGHGTSEAYSYQSYDVWESLCHECGENSPDSYLLIRGNRQDWSSPEKLRPSTCLHFSGKCIISTIVFITDIVHQALGKISCSRAAMVYRSKASIDSIYGFRTQSPTENQTMVDWLLCKDRFTCPTNIGELCWKFLSCLIVILRINLGVKVSICSNWNCRLYWPDILQWHKTNRNERYIIDW